MQKYKTFAVMKHKCRLRSQYFYVRKKYGAFDAQISRRNFYSFEKEYAKHATSQMAFYC